MDKYDRAVQWLLENPEHLVDAWTIDSKAKVAWPLFQFCGYSGNCPIWIKRGEGAFCDKIEERIADDPKIHSSFEKLEEEFFQGDDWNTRKQVLEAYAEVQRFVDDVIEEQESETSLPSGSMGNE